MKAMFVMFLINSFFLSMGFCNEIKADSKYILISSFDLVKSNEGCFIAISGVSYQGSSLSVKGIVFRRNAGRLDVDIILGICRPGETMEFSFVVKQDAELNEIFIGKDKKILWDKKEGFVFKGHELKTFPPNHISFKDKKKEKEKRDQ